jgi:low affinity Fe/Cu permease
MDEPIQSYESHRRWVPAFHFFVLPVLLVNVFVTILRLIDDTRGPTAWNVVVAVALFLGVFLLRGMPLRAQDRVIRLEERARLGGLLPNDLRARLDELTPAQFIALRFAPDDEVPDLTRRTLDGELKTPADIKRAIKNWRADTLRV